MLLRGGASGAARLTAGLAAPGPAVKGRPTAHTGTQADAQQHDVEVAVGRLAKPLTVVRLRAANESIGRARATNARNLVLRLVTSEGDCGEAPRDLVALP